VKKFWYRFLDWAAGKLDRVAAEALDKSRVQDIPQGEVIIFRTFMIATPDRPPETGLVWGDKSVDEICRELEGSV
jgi:hypothetical protein